MNCYQICLLVVFATLAVSCEAPPAPPFEDPRQNIPFDQRMREVEIKLIELARANADKSCPRTVFPRNATPEMLLEGSAEADILAVLAPSPLRKRCLDYCEELVSRDEFPPFRQVADHSIGFPPRSNSIAQPLSSSSLKQVDQVKIEELCGPLFEHIRRSTRYRDACNPYRPGGPLVDNNSISFLDVGRALWIFARSRLAEGNPEGVKQGLQLMTDASQFSNAVASESSRLVASGLQNWLLMQLEVLFNSRAPMSEELLQDYMVESKIIQDSWPDLSRMLENEALSWFFDFLAWDEKSECWKITEQGTNILGSSPSSCVSKEELKFYLAYYAARFSLVSTACSPGDLDLECARKAYSVFEEQRAYCEKYGDKRSILHHLAREVFSRFDIQSKTDTIEFLMLVQCSSIDMITLQMKGLVKVHFRMAAIRLLARYRLEYQRTGECPAEDFFERSDVRETRIDPVSGEPMKVKRIASGRFVIRPGVPIGTKLKPEEQPAVFIQCPFNDFGRD